VRLRVIPDAALVDDEIRIIIEDLRSGHPVRVEASLTDYAGLEWNSWAEFAVGPSPVLDLAQAAPRTGSYSGVQPMGLLWSMRPKIVAEAQEHAIMQGPGSVSVRIRAEQAGAPAAVQPLTVGWASPGVAREALDQDGLKGALWVPEGPPPFRPVLVVGGSDGGLREETAAVLASRGYLSLALAYFRFPGLPEELVRIPLEYFEAGLNFLGRDPRADPGRRIAVVGRSRGGELAVLLGATFPALIDAVVAYVPSGVVHSGIYAGGNSWQSDAPSWTMHEEPVPFLSHLPAGLAASEEPAPVRLTPIYCRDLANWPEVQAASIAVERSQARILLISGTDDAMWPSSLLSELVVARLQERGYQRPFQHLALPDAGHRFSFPTLPATVTAGRHPTDGQLYEYGGTAQGNSSAGQTSHRAMLEWLAMS